MQRPENIICDLQDKAKILFQVSCFKLKKKVDAFFTFVIDGDDMSPAINNNEEIKVLKWFDNYWIYTEVKFALDECDDKEYNIFFSLSIYEGDYDINTKQQLFRAEWDNYSRNAEHPQPHWHFHLNDKHEDLEEDFMEMIKDDEVGFMEMIQEFKSENLKFQKIHFAMNAQWESNEGHIHKAKDADSFVQWVFGLLEHIRGQLKYISK